MAGVIFIRIFAGHGAGHVPGTSWRRLRAASTPSQASKTAPLLTSPRDSQARPGARGWLPLIRPGDPCPGSRPAFASIPGCGQLPPSPAPRSPPSRPSPRLPVLRRTSLAGPHPPPAPGCGGAHRPAPWPPPPPPSSRARRLRRPPGRLRTSRACACALEGREGPAAPRPRPPSPTPPRPGRWCQLRCPRRPGSGLRERFLAHRDSVRPRAASGFFQKGALKIQRTPLPSPPFPSKGWGAVLVPSGGLLASRVGGLLGWVGRAHLQSTCGRGRRW